MDFRSSTNTVNAEDNINRTEVSRKTKVVAQGGNFVVHHPLPLCLLERANFKEGDEFTHITYTAVTKESDDSEVDSFPMKYQLRQRIFQRTTKVALVITMYNEDSDLFIKSLTAVQKI